MRCSNDLSRALSRVRNCRCRYGILHSLSMAVTVLFRYHLQIIFVLLLFAGDLIHNCNKRYFKSSLFHIDVSSFIKNFNKIDKNSFLKH